MEAIVENYFNKAGYLSQSIFVVKSQHIEILNDLFPNKNHEVYGEVNKLFEILDNFLVHNKSTNFSFVYDQIVSFGELLSTKIIAHYFIHQGLETEWVDARNCIKTDSYYRDNRIIRFLSIIKYDLYDRIVSINKQKIENNVFNANKKKI